MLCKRHYTKTLTYAILGIFLLCFAFSAHEVFAMDIKNVSEFLKKPTKNISLSKNDVIMFHGVKIHYTDEYDIATIGKNQLFKTERGDPKYNLPFYGGITAVAIDFPIKGDDSIAIVSAIDRYFGFNNHMLTKHKDSFILCSLIDTNGYEIFSFDASIGNNAFILGDTQLIEYTFTGPDGQVIYKTTHPGMFAGLNLNRIAVFENETWRIDNIGEYPDHYKRQLTAIDERLEQSKEYNDDDLRASNAILYAYCCIMTGENDANCIEKLHLFLTPQLSEYSKHIFQVIKKHANTFNPLTIERFSLSGNKLP
ncbi:MAG: hypothetical protein RDU30_03905 [Desulfovibrionaceae bacterium]|nr:hypothetical protein [Desulfovibrionaceae bacterium]